MGPKANESQRVSVIVSSLAKSLLERDAHLPSRAEAREALRAAASQLDAAERALLDKNFDAIADGVLQRLQPSLPTQRASGSSAAECARCVRNSAPGNASQLAAVATSKHRKEEQSSVEERVELAIAAVESGADVSVVDVLVHLASEREPLLRKALRSLHAYRADVLEKCATLSIPELADTTGGNEEHVHAFLQRVEAAREAMSIFRSNGDAARAHKLERSACSSPAPMTAAKLVPRKRVTLDPHELAELYITALTDAEFQQAKSTRRQAEDPPEDPSQAPDEDLFFVG